MAMSRYLAIMLGIIGVSGTPAVSEDKVRVACVGDSITEGTYENVYPKLLGDLLGAKYEVKNFGVGATTLLASGAKPYMKQSAFSKAIEFKPNFVIIMLGTNDSKEEDWHHSADFVRDYEKLIAAFEKLRTKPILYICTPPTVTMDNWDIRGEIVEKEIRSKVVEVGRKRKVEVVDVFGAFTGKEDLHADGIHPNAEGAESIAKTVHGTMTKKIKK
jgi:acyl-CoA thioesterase-1